MTAVNASASSLTPPLVMPQPAAPAQMGPGAAPVTSGNAGVPTKTLAPAPPERKQTPKLSPEQAVEKAIELFHATRSDLASLKDLDSPASADPNAHSPESADLKIRKEQELIIVHGWAIDAARTYYNLQKEKAKAAEGGTPQAAMLARNVEKAEILLEQAIGTPQEEAKAAAGLLKIASDQFTAAETKLKLEDAKIQPNSNGVQIGIAQKEFDAAVAKRRDAAEKNVYAAQAWAFDANQNGGTPDEKSNAETWVREANALLEEANALLKQVQERPRPGP
jgi:hypothetical protein